MVSLKKLIFGILITTPVLAGSPMIWKSGDYGQMLTTKGFLFKDGKVFGSTTTDPTSVGLSAQTGSVVLFGSGIYLKSGTADTAWVLTGGSAVVQQPYLPYFGSGAQGSVTILSGTTVTLSGDQNYQDLTIQNGAFLIPDAYRIFVNGVLDVSGITSAGGIKANGGQGGTAVSSCAAGTSQTNSTTRTLGGGNVGGSGGSGGSSTNGSGASTSSCPSSLCVGGRGGGGSRGGSSLSFLGGLSPVTSGTRSTINFDRYMDYMYQFGGLPIRGGFGGVGGGGSAAAVTGQVGPQGACGGGGGGVVDVRARIINRASSSVPIIDVSGGNGGGGATLAGATTGSSGGAGGGGGGFCNIYYSQLTGTSNAYFCNLSGGNGGPGNTNNVILAGVTQGGGGGGGQSGYGFALNLSTGDSISISTVDGTSGQVTGTTLSGGTAGVGGVTYLGL